MGPERGVLLFVSVLLAPTLFAVLSVFILLPGPHRDWLTAFFATLQVAFAATLCSAPALWILWLRWNVRPIHLTRPEWLLLAMTIAWAVCLWVPVFRLAKYLTLAQCPCCQQMNLVNAALQHRRLAEGRYFRCGVCDAEALLNVSQYSQGCPRCGKHTLINMEYSFRWCLNCGTRCKRLRRRSWVDATAPQDDHFYWLWTPAAWLRFGRHRIATKSASKQISQHEQRDS